MVQVYPATLYDRSFDTRILVQARLEASTLYIQRENDTLNWTAGDLDDARQLDDGSVVLQNNNLFLEVLEPGFAQAVKSAFENDKLFHRPFFDRIGLKGLLIALLIVIAPLLLVYFWFVPVAAERASQHVSPAIEEQIGEAWYESMIQQYTLDSIQTRQVQTFYDSLHYGVGYNIRNSVVKEPAIHALPTKPAIFNFGTPYMRFSMNWPTSCFLAF